jgi:hypothetical protein
VSPHQIIAVAVRLLAIWLAVQGTGTALSIYQSGESHFALIFALCAAVLVTLLWMFPQSIARKVLSTSETQSTVPATPDTWLTMGCALIGLWLMSSAVPSLIGELLALHLVGSQLNDTTGIYVWIVRFVLEIAVALWLILGAKGFRKIYRWAQNAGTTKAP